MTNERPDVTAEIDTESEDRPTLRDLQMEVIARAWHQCAGDRHRIERLTNISANTISLVVGRKGFAESLAAYEESESDSGALDYLTRAKAMIDRAMAENGGSKKRAAAALGTSYTMLQRTTRAATRRQNTRPGFETPIPERSASQIQTTKPNVDALKNQLKEILERTLGKTRGDPPK